MGWRHIGHNEKDMKRRRKMRHATVHYVPLHGYLIRRICDVLAFAMEFKFGMKWLIDGEPGMS
jgi:hypothetical protein